MRPKFRVCAWLTEADVDFGGVGTWGCVIEVGPEKKPRVLGGAGCGARGIIPGNSGGWRGAGLCSMGQAPSGGAVLQGLARGWPQAEARGQVREPSGEEDGDFGWAVGPRPWR